jgi:hypothetical protein
MSAHDIIQGVWATMAVGRLANAVAPEATERVRSFVETQIVQPMVDVGVETFCPFETAKENAEDEILSSSFFERGSLIKSKNADALRLYRKEFWTTAEAASLLAGLKPTPTDPAAPTNLESLMVGFPLTPTPTLVLLLLLKTNLVSLMVGSPPAPTPIQFRSFPQKTQTPPLLLT